ncbi:pknD [Symbiodinium microadriaticum]|nr:pknD [Symbiodinium microadriaticum]
MALSFLTNFAKGFMSFFLVEERAVIHLNLPESDWNSIASPRHEGGVRVNFGGGMLFYGLDPAIAEHRRMSGLDFAFVATDGSKQLALRMNFTSVPTQIQQHVNKQQDNSSPMTTTDVQLLVPVQGIRSPSPLAEFLDRQVGALSVRSVFAPALLEKDRDMQKLDDPSAVTFHEGDMYITDRGNHRVLKVRPGKLGGEVFFGGDGTGSALHQLAWPENIAFSRGRAYIADCGNDRVLEVKPGEKKGKIVFGSLKGPSDVTFFEGNAYIVEKPRHRILKVKLGASHGETFFGGNQSAWSSLTSLLYPQRISFYGGKAYIVDTQNARILKVTPGEKKAELFFGQKWSGDTLAQLNTPASITFFQGSAYIADAMNSRILKLAPFMREAEVFFEGAGYLSDVTFFDGGAYVANAGMGNRILKVRPTGTEIFYGDRALLLHSSWLRSLKMHEGHAYIVDEGAGRVLKIEPGQLGGEIAFPPLGRKACLRDVTFHKGSMYIVDPGCSAESGGRILRLEPGQEEAAVFFGEEKKGSSLHQLHRPSSITFFGDAAYIVDSGNHRILKLTPGSFQGSLFFGGHGSSLEQLNDPSSITFYRGYAYIVDRGNHRVLEVKPGVPGQTALRIFEIARPEYQAEPSRHPFSLGETLQRCGHARQQVQRGSRMLYLENCRMPLPAGFDKVLPNKSFAALNISVANMDKVILRVQTAELGLRISPSMPTAEVAFLLLLVALPSFVAHASNDRTFHIICLVYLAVAAWLSVRLRFAELPFASSPFLCATSLLLGVLWPWAPVPVFIAASFGELTATAFTEKEQKLSCSNGVSWELHLFTALLSAFCTSLWAIVLDGMGIKRLAAETAPPWSLQRAKLVVSWVYDSIGDRYLDLTSFLVMKACGYEYSWLPLIFLLAALIMQNVGGLLYASFVVHKACNCRYALIWAVMMPPWKLVDLDLEAVGNFGTAVRLLVQDFPQLAVKLHFTFSFYASWFVVSDCAITLCVAAIDLLALARAGYRPTYHQLLLPHETSRAMTRGDGPETP